MSKQPYQLDDLDRALIAKIRDAIPEFLEGHPMKDFLDDDDLHEGVQLLIDIIDAGGFE